MVIPVSLEIRTVKVEVLGVTSIIKMPSESQTACVESYQLLLHKACYEYASTAPAHACHYN